MRKIHQLKASIKQKIEKQTSRTPSPALRAESSKQPAKTDDDPVPIHTRLEASVQHAQEAMSQLQPPQLFARDLVSVVDDTNSAVDETITLANTWQPLLNNLKIFSDLADKVAEVRLSVLIHSTRYLSIL
jgi:hypothetical protein